MKMHIATPTQNKQKYKIIAHTFSDCDFVKWDILVGPGTTISSIPSDFRVTVRVKSNILAIM